jgi:cell division initiation protein
MKITPLDIESQSFRKKLRGIDPQEVQSFLQLVSEEYEKLFAENLRLQEDLGAMEKLLEEHRGRETTLRETLVTAQKVAGDVKGQAKREAELLLKGAQLQADELVQGAQTRAAELDGSLGGLRMEHQGYLKKLRAMLEHHMELLELHEEKVTQDEKVQVLQRKAKAEES